MNLKTIFLLLLTITFSFCSAEPFCPTCFKKIAEAHTVISLRVQHDDTLNSLEHMRGENGLVKDAVFLNKNSDGSVVVVPLNPRVAPTNIALDLLIQAELATASKPPLNAHKNVKKILETLSKFPYHKESGLFFREYDSKGYLALQKDISAIDNLHLALALWTVAETFPETQDGKQARKLFNRMDFSSFTDPKKGLLHGNIAYQNKKWKVEDYHFGNFGSEARSFYSLGYALGLFRKVNTENFPEETLSNLKFETAVWNDGKNERKLLKTWDGGAFQLLLPNLLIDEAEISSKLKSRFENYADYILEEQKVRQLPLPAGHSASASGIDFRSKNSPKLEYIAKAGNTFLVSKDNEDLNDKKTQSEWDSIVTPHAFILASTISPPKYETAIKDAVELKSGNNALYEPGFGWMDGYSVSGKNKNQVIPVQLALDQGMIQLSLFKREAPDNKTLSARALKNNKQVYERLKKFYDEVDKKLK